MTLFREAPELLAPFRDGRPDALARVYRHYVRSLDGYLRALARHARAAELAQPSVVADLLQEAFVRAFSERARLAYDGLREYSPYLNTIAHNCFMDALRRRRKESLLAGTEHLIDELRAPDAQEMYDANVLAVLQQYLSELSREQQSVYEQRFVFGVSQEAACEALGLSRRSLRTAEEHLRSGLRKALQLAGLLHDVSGGRAHSAKALQLRQE
jgi:RNA polymerase sigma-70 factor, ECF subfamily